MRKTAFLGALVLAACGGASAGSGTAGSGASGGGGGPSVTIEAGHVASGPADFEPTAAAMLAQHLDEVKSCYARQLARDATLSGRVDVDFTIGTVGTLSEQRARTRGNLDAATAGCVTDVIAPFAFAPPPSAAVTLTYTLVFAP